MKVNKRFCKVTLGGDDSAATPVAADETKKRKGGKGKDAKGKKMDRMTAIHNMRNAKDQLMKKPAAVDDGAEGGRKDRNCTYHFQKALEAGDVPAYVVQALEKAPAGSKNKMKRDIINNSMKQNEDGEWTLDLQSKQFQELAPPINSYMQCWNSKSNGL